MYSQRALVEVLAHQAARPRPRAEAEEGVVAHHVVAPHEADFRIEVVADGHAFELHAVAIPGVIELSAVAGVAAVKAGRLGARPVGVDEQVLEEGERPVNAVGLVGRRCPTAPPSDW